MLTATLRYPEDPPLPVLLLFGREFVRYFRADQPAKMEIFTPQTAEEFEAVREGRGSGPVQTIPIPADALLCDTCNARIGLLDACALVGTSRLYCASCLHEHLEPYLTDLQVSPAAGGQ